MDISKVVLPVIEKVADVASIGSGGGGGGEKFTAFHHDFNANDGTGFYGGGLCTDPTSPLLAFIEIDGANSVVQGKPVGSSATENCISCILTNPIMGISELEIDIKKIITYGGGDELQFFLFDSDDENIVKIAFGQFLSFRSINIIDKALVVVESPYTNSGLFSPNSGKIKFRIDLTNKMLYVSSDDWPLSPTSASLSAGGTMNSTNIKRLTICMKSNSGATSTADMQVDSITLRRI